MIAPILALALCLRFGLFLVAAPHPDRFYTPDAYDEYVPLGLHFREAYAGRSGHLFDLSLLRTPGYPLLLNAVYTMVGEKPWTVTLLQVALSVLTVWLTYLIGVGLFGPRAAWWASLALAIDPISIIMPNYVQPETLFTFVLVVGSLSWLQSFRQRFHVWSARAGILLGASALIRDVTLYLPAVLIPIGWIFHRHRWSTRLVLSGVFLLTFALPVGGWIARNYRVTGVPVLSTVHSINLLYFRAAPALAWDEGLSRAESQTRLQETLDGRTRPGMNQAEISRLATQLAFETLAKHPVGAIVVGIKGAAVLLAGPGRAELLRLLGAAEPKKIETILQGLLVGVQILVLGLIMLGAGWGCYGLLRAGKYFELIALASFIIYFIVLSSGGNSSSRYRTPIMPYFALLAGYAIASQLPAVSERGGSSLGEVK